MDITVTRFMFDAAGEVTADKSLAATMTYNVKLQKLITGFSTNALSVKKVKTASTFEFVAPNKGGIQSSTPISGYYQITCAGPTGEYYTSSDILYSTNP